MAGEFYRGLGTRKTAVAQVRIKHGTGTKTVNGRDMLAYLCRQNLVTHAVAPLEDTKLLGKIDIIAKVDGGGLSGQAGALRLAIARALVNLDPQYRAALKKKGFLNHNYHQRNLPSLRIH